MGDIYVLKPEGGDWFTNPPYAIVELDKINASDEDLSEDQKTAEFVKNHFRVVNPPKGFRAWKFLHVDAVLKCENNSLKPRLLTRQEFVDFVKPMLPNKPYPSWYQKV